MDTILSIIFDFDFKIQSLATKSTTCKINCESIDGRMPFLYEADSVLSHLFKNGSISATEFPIFTEDSWRMRAWVSEVYGFLI